MTPSNTPVWSVTTLPAVSEGQKAPHVIVTPTYTDPVTGARYIHRDLEETMEPWQVEDHIPPINRIERFGDVESWTQYIRHYGKTETLLLTWGEKGLRAILDYAAADGTPGRCQWIAEHPFTLARQWQKWAALTTGAAYSQRQIIEHLETLGEDIVDPPAHELMNLLRKLRATVNTQASSDLNEDGSTKVTYSQAKTVTLELPSLIEIAIPALAGHTDPPTGSGQANGAAVLYQVAVRLRVSVGDDGRLAFRLSIPNAERVLADAFDDRVQAARALLGAGYDLLRSV